MDESMTPERLAELTGWNTPRESWRIWSTSEYREYITRNYDHSRYSELGQKNSSDQEFIASIEEFLLYARWRQRSAEIPQHHQALAEYLRSREGEFGTLSDLAYDVLNEHRKAFLELTDKTSSDDFHSWGNSASPQWTAAYLDILERIPAPSSSEDSEPDNSDTVDWKAKHDALWEALRAEAEERDWCDEFDEFAKANGGPDREVAKTVTMDIQFSIKRPYRETTAPELANLSYSQRQDLMIDAVLAELDVQGKLFSREEFGEAFRYAMVNIGVMRLAGE